MSELQSILNSTISKKFPLKTFLQNSVLSEGKSLIFQDSKLQNKSQIYLDKETNYLSFLSDNGLLLAAKKISFLADNLNIRINEQIEINSKELDIKNNATYVKSNLIDITSLTTQINSENLLELTSDELMELKSKRLKINVDETFELTLGKNKISLDENGFHVNSNSTFDGDVKFTGSTIFESASSLTVKNKDGENFKHLLRVEQTNDQSEMSLIELKQSNKTGSFLQFEGESVLDNCSGNIVCINDNIDTVEEVAFLSIKILDNNQNGIKAGEYFIKAYLVK